MGIFTPKISGVKARLLATRKARQTDFRALNRIITKYYDKKS